VGLVERDEADVWDHTTWVIGSGQHGSGLWAQPVKEERFSEI
jgi:hypothetical protein